MIRVVTLPWGYKHPDVVYYRQHKVHVYKGKILPSSLQPFASQDFSYERWIEDELNRSVMPPLRGKVKFTPRDHQLDAAKAIVRSYREGWRGFLEADETGLGKTLSTLSGVCAAAQKAGFSRSSGKAKVLIVCPKGAIPVWRNTLHAYPVSAGLIRPLVTNYHQLNKLLNPPPQAAAAKKKKTKDRQTARDGTPRVDWDFVIFDEAQYLKNYPDSNVSLAAVSVAKLNSRYERGKTPFTVFCTATPGSTPLSLSVMAGIIAPGITRGAQVTPKTWGKFLEDKGFQVSKGKNGVYRWISDPWPLPKDASREKIRAYKAKVQEVKKQQRADSRRIGVALLQENAPFIKRSPKDIAGWPEQNLMPYPIKLSGSAQMLYMEAWSRFRSFLRMPGARRDSKSALVENLRYRQKTSLLKVDPMKDLILEAVEDGKQVYISVEFMETVDAYAKIFNKAKIKFSEISGRNAAEREEERLKFQRGESKIAISTVVEALSLHSSEQLPDGTRATSTPRVTVIHDTRQNDLSVDQSLGRAHREGQNSNAYFPYFEKTVDERVISRYVNKRSNRNTMLGTPEDEVLSVEELFEQVAQSSDLD